MHPATQSSDATVGSLLVLLSVVIFVYYTLWVIVIVRRPPCPLVAAAAARAARAAAPLAWAAAGQTDSLSAFRRYAQPFVDEDHFVQTLFPDWTYAIKIPAVLFVVLVTVIVAFISLVMIKSRKPKSS